MAILFVLAIFVGIRWWQEPASDASDLYATIPFRPKVTYDSSNITVSNTEAEPYMATSLRVYVGSTLYSLDIGTIQPRETMTSSLLSLTSGSGESFQPGLPKTSELEVRAHFGGHDVHKDFPPPP